MRTVSSGRKTVLLATTLHLASTARLAMALLDCGVRVAVVCPRGHWVNDIDRVDDVLPYSGLSPLESLRDAIFLAQPDLMIPCDDRAAAHMQELEAAWDHPLANVLRASLSAARHYPLTQSRYAFLTFAQTLGIAIPPTNVLNVDSDVEALTVGTGPWVVKADHTWAGMGVRIVHSTEEAQQAFRAMKQAKRLRTVISETLIDRDFFGWAMWFARQKNEITLQSHIDGGPANCAIACWRGEVVGLIMVAVVEAESATGPASVIRLIDHPQMAHAARTLVRALGISGMIGLDFMLDRAGNALLLEINARNVPMCHIPLGGQRDLVERLVARLEDRPARDRAAITSSDYITYFPYAWHRNPADPSLTIGYHDVPWQEPRLLRRLLSGEQRRDRSVVARLLQRLRGRRVFPLGNRGPAQASSDFIISPAP